MIVFHGTPFQRGYGLGSFFQSLKRVAIPFLQKGAKALGRAALNTGLNVAQDVLKGNSLKSSARSRLQQTAKTLKDQALNQLTTQTGRGVKRLKPEAFQEKLTLVSTGKVKRAKRAPSRKKNQLLKKGKPKAIKAGDIFGSK